jgi:hypothetical protein
MSPFSDVSLMGVDCQGNEREEKKMSEVQCNRPQNSEWTVNEFKLPLMEL